MNQFIKLCQFLGLHPLVAFGMLAVDWMLFGGVAASVFTTWPIEVGWK